MRTMKIFLIVASALHAGAATACWEDVGQKYGINPQVLYAIAKTESSLNPKAINRNRNGTYDVGLMQINSSWFPALVKLGIKEENLYHPCTSIEVGAWILAQNIRRFGYSWDAIGAYNSSKPNLRLRYAKKVYLNLPYPRGATRQKSD